MQCRERVYSVRGSTPAIGGEGVCCEEKICNIKNMTSTVQGEKGCNTRRVASAVTEKFVQCEVCGLRRKTAVSGMSYLQYWVRKYAVPGGSHL